MSDQTLTTLPTHRLDAFASPVADPAVVHLDGVDFVVLTSAGQTDVSAWTSGAVTTLPAGTPVAPVTDLNRAGTVLRQAIASLNRLRQRAEQALGSSRNRQVSILDEIRSYAIEAHLAGTICRDGLNDFLVSFDLSEYNPRVCVAYTLGGTVTVAAAPADHVLTNPADVFRPNLEQIDYVDAETAEHETMLRRVTPTTLADGHSGFTVSYAINGTYVLDHDDPDEAEADCLGYLRPDLDAIKGLMTGIDRFTVEAVTADYND